VAMSRNAGKTALRAVPSASIAPDYLCGQLAPSP
jgi:hypothetical protein